MSQHHQKLDRWKWAKIARQVIERDGGVCRVPDPHDCTIVATQADHIVPLRELLAAGGDPYDPRNARAACRNGNNARNRTIPHLDTGGHW